MRHRSPLIIVLVSLTAILIAVGGWLVTRPDSPTAVSGADAVSGTPTAGVQRTPAVVRNYVDPERTTLAAAVSAAVRKGSIIPSLTSSDAGKIGSRAAEAIAVYTDQEGGWVEFDRFMLTQGLTTPDTPRAGRDEASWAARTATLRGTTVELEKVAVKPRVVRGRPLPNEPNVPMFASFSAFNAGPSGPAPRGSNDVADPLTAGATVVEVLVPARLRTRAVPGYTTGEEEFDGRIGLTMTKRPSDGEWILTGVSLRDVPNGQPVAVPPLR